MKIVDLFGNEITIIEPNKRKREKTLFDDYEGFVEKFEVKKTTDDCYTPPAVYQCVLEWVRENCDIEGARIVRPFYPGGDYEMEDYQPNDVVVDNPPFSILTQIVKFYQKRGIRFFLFGPHLTIFTAGRYCTTIVTNATIMYENKASVNTDFVSNMFGTTGVIVAGDLHDRLKAATPAKADLPIYRYPDNVISAGGLGAIVSRGISFRIDSTEMEHVGTLDCQRSNKKGIFGGGFLISDQAAERAREAAERAREAAEREKKEKSVIWELSQREREIIKRLSRAE